MNVAIVVAAGKGTRLGGNQPKQFLELCGVPIIIHTLRQFERCEEINEIIVVVPAESTAAFSSLTEKFAVRKLVRVATGAAILVAPVADTIKDIENGRVKRTLTRHNLRRALTPQCFSYDLLKRAYDQLDEVESAGVEVTDDSLLVERLGAEIVAVEGSARNIKITEEEDLALAETLLQGFK